MGYALVYVLGYMNSDWLGCIVLGYAVYYFVFVCFVVELDAVPFFYVICPISDVSSSF